MQGAFPDAHIQGIDLSPAMVAAAREQGIDAEVIDLCDMEATFDVITAVFDVLNYLDPKELERFGSCVRDRLEPGGYFLCDVNTLYGFEEVAVGAFFAEDSERFVAVDGEFNMNKYISNFTLFERGENGCWQPERATIRQYYYPLESVGSILGMTMISHEDVNLFGDEPDKKFIIFKK
jgi:SAM-dependent methyltransferase